MTDLMICAHCKHFKPDPKDLRRGFCNRYPPAPVFAGVAKGMPQIRTVSPMVVGVQTCGEFSSRIAALPPEAKQ